MAGIVANNPEIAPARYGRWLGPGIVAVRAEEAVFHCMIALSAGHSA